MQKTASSLIIRCQPGITLAQISANPCTRLHALSSGLQPVLNTSHRNLVHLSPGPSIDQDSRNGGLGREPERRRRSIRPRIVLGRLVRLTFGGRQGCSFLHTGGGVDLPGLELFVFRSSDVGSVRVTSARTIELA